MSGAAPALLSAIVRSTHVPCVVRPLQQRGVVSLRSKRGGGGHGGGSSSYSPAAAVSQPEFQDGLGVQAEHGLAPDDLEFTFEPPPLPAAVGGLRATGSGGPSSSSLAAAALQARLCRARTAGHVLEVIAGQDAVMDATHAASALHRLARLGAPGRMVSVGQVTDPAVARLVARLGAPDALEGLSSQSLCCLCLALSRLQLAPQWYPQLLQACAAKAPGFSGHQISTALHALVKLEGVGAGQEARKSLLEALHQELRRRQRSLGPGGTSALDTVLIADALARLQIKDEGLFSSLAQALRKHLQGGELGIRELRHVVTAFSSIGLVDTQLSGAVCRYLSTRLNACSGNDLAALAFSLSRVGSACGPAHGELFQAMVPEIMARHATGSLGGRDAASLLHAATHAGVAPPELVLALADAVQTRPDGLNGQDLSLLVPCLAQVLPANPALGSMLGDRVLKCVKMLSPRQLARLVVGFGGSGVRDPKLWEALQRESLNRETYFAVPDVLRLLAGFDAAGQSTPKLQRAFWGIVREKQLKFLAEESLALLQLWPRIDGSLRRQIPEVQAGLLKNLRTRMERRTGGQYGWSSPVEFTAELLEWLPETRDLQPSGRLDLKLLKAVLRQLPEQMQRATGAEWERLVAATCQDAEILIRARVEVQQQPMLQQALGDRLQRWLPAVFPGVPAEGAVAPTPGLGRAAQMCHQLVGLGFDGGPVRGLLRDLIAAVGGDARRPEGPSYPLSVAAQVCWSSAEARVYPRDVVEIAGAHAALISPASGGDLPEGAAERQQAAAADPVAAIRISWAALASGAPPAVVTQLLQPLGLEGAADVESHLGPSDLRPAQQVAWHALRASGASGAGVWARAALERGPGVHASPSVEQELTTLLQQLRVPHVLAGGAGGGAPPVTPGGIGFYRVPVWFPQPGAVLDVDVQGDKLASGALCGGAELRRQQLRGEGLRVLTFEPSSLTGATKEKKLRGLAEQIATSCPEAMDWLATAPVAGQNTGGEGGRGGEPRDRPRFEEV